jgi:hypothetical protein
MWHWPARFLGDERKRKLIARLEADGWPLFRIAGKRAAYPSDLAAKIAGMRPTTERKRARRKT